MTSAPPREQTLPVLREIEPGIHLCLQHIEHAQGVLLPEEESLALGVTPMRLREIRAGRTVARRAMANAGVKPGPIRAGAAGEPLWPQGVCGSVSHTSHHAVAVIGKSASCDSLGIDLDDDRELGEAASREIAKPEEIKLLREAEFSATYPYARPENLVFCAKEAIFKCQFNMTRLSDLDFLDVLLVGPPRGNYFALRVADHVSEKFAHALSRIITKFYCFQGLILACAFAMPRSAIVCKSDT